MIGEIKIDFQVIDSGDPDIIMIADFSSWLQIEDKPAVVSITIPGSRNPIQFNFDKGKINGFNSNNLSFGCSTNCDEPYYSNLPDGIYDIKLEASPNTFNKQRYYLKTDKTRLELDKLILDLGFNFEVENKSKIENLQLIDFIIMAANSAIRLGDVVTASTNFKEALRLIEKEKNCKDC